MNLNITSQKNGFFLPVCRRAQNHHLSRGFSLLELMIVLAVVAILASIAYPSYRESVAKTKRAQAAVQLLEAAQYMQRFYSQNDRYDQTNAATPVTTTLPTVLVNVPKESTGSSKSYSLSFATDSLKTNAFTLQAVPANSMANDKCGKLRLDNVGRRSLADNMATATLEYCWH